MIKRSTICMNSWPTTKKKDCDWYIPLCLSNSNSFFLSQKQISDPECVSDSSYPPLHSCQTSRFKLQTSRWNSLKRIRTWLHFNCSRKGFEIRRGKVKSPFHPGNILADFLILWCWYYIVTNSTECRFVEHEIEIHVHVNDMWNNSS